MITKKKYKNKSSLAMLISLTFSVGVLAEESLDEKKQEHLKEEIADVAVYLLRICMAFNINLEEAIVEKMQKNAIKYPLFDENGQKIDYGKKK